MEREYSGDGANDYHLLTDERAPTFGMASASRELSGSSTDDLLNAPAQHAINSNLRKVPSRPAITKSNRGRAGKMQMQAKLHVLIVTADGTIKDDVITRTEIQLRVLANAVTMSRRKLQARDLRFVDPSFSANIDVIVRNGAILVIIEGLRAVITRNECIIVYSADRVTKTGKDEDTVSSALISKRRQISIEFAHSISERIADARAAALADAERSAAEGALRDFREGFASSNATHEEEAISIPLELCALEGILAVYTRDMDTALNELSKSVGVCTQSLTRGFSAKNLDRLRQIKYELSVLKERARGIHGEIAHILDDDDEMSAMYLTKIYEDKLAENQELLAQSEELSPVRPQQAPSSLEPSRGRMSVTSATLNQMSRLGTSVASQSSAPPEMLPRSTSQVYHGAIEAEAPDEVELLLETYLQFFDRIIRDCTTIDQSIESAEDYLALQLDAARNRLLFFDLAISIFSLGCAIGGVIVGYFGMNFDTSIFTAAYDGNLQFVLVGISCIVLLTFAPAVLVKWMRNTNKLIFS